MSAASSPEFPARPESVGTARRWVLGQAGLDGDARDVLALLVSELAANAVLHARTPFRVRVDRNAAALRVAVIDQGHQGRPEVADLDPGAVTGRGLRLIDELALDWGVATGPRPPTTVWFTLAG